VVAIPAAVRTPQFQKPRPRQTCFLTKLRIYK